MPIRRASSHFIFLCALGVGLLLLALPAVAAAQTFGVNTTADGETVAVPPACNGSNECTLREAIERANEEPGPDTIKFTEVPSGTPQLLVSETPLPTITEQVAIEGDTLPGATAGVPALELAPVDMGGGFTTGFNIHGGSGTRIEGFAIGGFTVGIEVGPNEEPPTDTEICGDYLGTELKGEAAVPNLIGVEVRAPIEAERPEGTVIGGPGCAENVISANSSYGVWDAGLDTKIAGNRIGIGAEPDGLELPNGTADDGSAGVFESALASGGTIGGTDPSGDEGNLIFFNRGAGVKVVGSAGEISIRQDYFFENEGLAIEIEGGTPPAPPEITRAESPVEGEFEVEGTVTGTEGEEVELDVYGSPACDPGGSGEGQTFLGTETVLIGAGGTTPFSFTLPSPPGDDTAITATSTREAGATSEFSQCATYVPPPPPPPPEPQTFTVTTTEDAYHGECTMAVCSLRDAIEAANATAVEDTIDFEVEGTIEDQFSPLPAITEPVEINGASVPGYPGTPVVEIDGAALTAASGTTGLVVRSGGSGSTITGLAIGHFDYGVLLEGTDNQVCGSYLGVETDGTTQLANEIGIEAAPGSAGDRIGAGCAAPGGGNLISANTAVGIDDHGSETRIADNRIGINANGEPMGNGEFGAGAGIVIGSESSHAMVGRIDGETGNVIAYNQDPGIVVAHSASVAKIRGNSIFENSGLGIEIELEPPTVPTVTGVTVGTGILTFSGEATAGPSEEGIELDFFASQTCDPSGAGEGQTFLGSESFESVGGATAYETEGLNATLPPGQNYITATSTGSVLGQTTEFSQCFLYVPPAGTLTVTTLEDSFDGECTEAVCSLRDAIEAANESSNHDTIDFEVPGTIKPHEQDLPELTEPVTIDGTSAPGYAGTPVVTIDGTEALSEGATEGLVVGGSAEGSTIKGLTITNFAEGIVVGANHTLLESDTVAHNEGLGIQVSNEAPATAIRRSEIYDDGGTPIEFKTPNAVPAPVLESFAAGPTATTFTVPVEGLANETYGIDVFANAQCEASEFGPAEVLVGTGSVTTDSGGHGTAEITDGRALTGIDAESFTVTATEEDTGTTSQIGHCARTQPGTEIESTPPAVSPAATATFTFSGHSTGQIASYECSLDGADFESCTSPQEYEDLADGSHTFRARAVSDEGAKDPVPPSYTWTIDTEPPEVTITAAPTGTTKSTGATLEFTATDTGSPVTAIECSLDGADFGACTSPQTYTGLADGPHTFEVKATDEAGNTSDPVSRSWEVDTEPPEVTITAAPTGTTKSTGATLEFTATDTGSPVTAIECSLDGADFGACTSPQTYTGLAGGPHTFEVKATDEAGNTSDPVSRSWTIKTEGPTPAITAAPPASTESTTASFEFGAPGATGYECSLDGGAFTPCTSPQTFSGLSPGAHSFAVRATDEVENTGPPAAYEWTVSSPPPQQQKAEPPPPAEEPAPTNGEKVVIQPEEGKVLIKLPGSKKFVSLEELKEIPVGAVIDATKGKLLLTSIDPDGTEQSADFFGGIFKVKQREGAGLVVLELLDTTVCTAAPRSAAASRALASSLAARPGSGTSGKLWGSGHGNFRTEGNNGSATVRGTIWLVEDRCNGTTLFRTRRGIVTVHDFTTHKTLPLPAGKTYVAGEG